MKRIISVLLFFSLLLSAGICRAESSPLIYRVTDDAGHTLYLMGTIHLGNEDMYPLGDAFEEAWQASGLLAVEADVLAIRQNPFLYLKYNAGMMYAPGDCAKNHLSQETYALGVQTRGTSEFLLNRMRPMAWVSLAEKEAYALSGYTSEMGVDTCLIRRAREEKKPVAELEGLDAQLEIFRLTPDEAADRMILQILENLQGAAAGVQMLQGAWQRGDELYLKLIIQASRGNYPKDLEEAYRTYDRLLYSGRNEGFARQADEYLRSGQTVLIAIGMAHIIGSDGVAQRLQDAGYRVERVR